jgi:hypothetical protein
VPSRPQAMSLQADHDRVVPEVDPERQRGERAHGPAAQHARGGGTRARDADRGEADCRRKVAQQVPGRAGQRPLGMRDHEGGAGAEERPRRATADATALDEHPGRHPAAEDRQHLGHRPQHLGRLAAGLRKRDPGDARAGERRHAGELAHAPAADPQRRPPDERQQRVERDLDRQRPHGRIQPAGELRRQVLGEQREPDEAVVLDQAPVAGAVEERHRSCEC